MIKGYCQILEQKISSLSDRESIECLPNEISIICKLVFYSKMSLIEIINLKLSQLSCIYSYHFYSKSEMLFLKDVMDYLLLGQVFDEFLFDSAEARVVLLRGISSLVDDLLENKNLICGDEKGLMPDVICLGMPKSATTWFYELIKNLNFVDCGGRKEIEYFNSTRYMRGNTWYGNHFSEESKIKIDVSVGYLGDNYKGMARIIDYAKSHNNQFKYLLFVRKPSERCVSYLTYRVLKGRGFYNLKKYCSSFHAYFNFIKQSDYQQHIDTLLKSGIKAERLFVVFQEDVWGDSEAVFKQIVDFISESRFVDRMGVCQFNNKVNIARKVVFFKLFKLLTSIYCHAFFYLKSKKAIYVVNKLYNGIKKILTVKKKDVKLSKMVRHEVAEKCKSLDLKYDLLKEYCEINRIYYSNIKGS